MARKYRRFSDLPEDIRTLVSAAVPSNPQKWVTQIIPQMDEKKSLLRLMETEDGATYVRRYLTRARKKQVKMENSVAWELHREKYWNDVDVDNCQAVENLFELCDEDVAFVTAKGWRHLIKKYSVSRLLEFARRSDLIDDEEPSDAVHSLVYKCLTAGYNPLSDSIGKYDQSGGTFTDNDGNTSTVVGAPLSEFLATHAGAC